MGRYLSRVCAVICICGILPQVSFGQSDAHLDSLISWAKSNNPYMAASQLAIDQASAQSIFDLEDPQLLIQSPSTEFYTIGVYQSFESPFTYFRKRDARTAEIELRGKQKILTEKGIELQVQELYNTVAYFSSEVQIYQSFDTLINNFVETATRKRQAGLVDSLQLLIAHNSKLEFINKLTVAKEQLANAVKGLALFCGVNTSKIQKPTDYSAEMLTLGIELGDSSTNTIIDVAKAQIVKAEIDYKLKRSQIFEGFSIGYMNQGARNSPIGNRFELGISVPLWFWKHKKQMKIARLEIERTENNMAGAKLDVQIKINELFGEALRMKTQIMYYEQTMLLQLQQTQQMAQRLFEAGESEFSTILLAQKNLFDGQLRYNKMIHEYTNIMFRISYYTG